MTTTDLYPSGSATAPAPMIDRALAIRAEVEEAAKGLPEGDVLASVRYGLWRLDDTLAERDRLLNDDDPDPYAVRAPDMGLDWDVDSAREYLDDEALEAAKGCWRRLDEGLRREKNSGKGEMG